MSKTLVEPMEFLRLQRIWKIQKIFGSFLKICFFKAFISDQFCVDAKKHENHEVVDPFSIDFDISKLCNYRFYCIKKGFYVRVGFYVSGTLLKFHKSKHVLL